MGCFFPNKEKNTIRSDKTTNVSKKGSFSTKETKDLNNLSKKGLSIKVEEFINQKNYNKFSMEYEVLDYIGKGSFGTVKKVKHLQTNQIRAMKIISRGNYKLNEQNNLFKEIEILRQLVFYSFIRIIQIF